MSPSCSGWSLLQQAVDDGRWAVAFCPFLPLTFPSGMVFFFVVFHFPAGVDLSETAALRGAGLIFLWFGVCLRVVAGVGEACFVPLREERPQTLSSSMV